MGRYTGCAPSRFDTFTGVRVTFLGDLERDAAGVRDIVRAALENGTPLRVTGARSWLGAGRPVTARDDLPMTSSGIVEYVPGDLTMTVRAGTPLQEIASATEANRQWLPLDPFGSPNGTIGATVATASAGPLAHAFGTPRDQVIGLGFVTGKGDYVRSGGRVVKNVAGFDLTRLLIGSWGTLGAITDATLRLRAQPEEDVTIALVLSGDNLRFRRTFEEISDAALVPYAMELVNAGVAAALGLEADAVLLTRFGGNRAVVKAQRDVLARFGEIRDLDPAVWQRFRTFEPADVAVARFSSPLSDLIALWQRIERELAEAQPLLHATPARGVVRCMVPRGAAEQLVRLAHDDPTVQRVFERLPANSWTDVPQPANDALSLRVREAFDPARLMNPGILASQ
jgi:glycolate oxidase FAD binding subunit